MLRVTNGSYKTTIETSDFTVAIIKYDKVLDVYRSLTGNEQEKRRAVREWISAEIIEQIGQDMARRIVKEIDFNEMTGVPSLLISTG